MQFVPIMFKLYALMTLCRVTMQLSYFYPKEVIWLEGIISYPLDI